MLRLHSKHRAGGFVCVPFMRVMQDTVKANSNATLIKKKALPTLVIANILFVCGLVLFEFMAPMVISTTLMRVLRTVMNALVMTATIDRVMESKRIIPSELIASVKNRVIFNSWTAPMTPMMIRNILIAPNPRGLGRTTP